MSRRRRRRREDQDDGLIDQILEIAIDCPPVGLIAAALFAVGGAVIWFGFPTLHFGLFRLVAVVFWCLAAAALLGAAVGWVVGWMRAAAGRRTGVSHGPAAEVGPVPAPSPRVPAGPPMPPPAPTAPAVSPPGSHLPPPPVCPRCHVPMVGRVVRRGPHAGRPFWGCPRYPACDHVVNAN